MKMTVLASGSKGNSTVVSSSHTRVLVDAGLSCRELMKRMAAMGEDPYSLDAILITHEHADHVAGLPVMARKLGIPVYMTEATHREWVRQMTPRRRISFAAWLEQRKAEKIARDEELAASLSQAPKSEWPDEHFFAAEGVPEHHLEKLEAAAAEDCEQETQPVEAKPGPAQLPHVEHFRPGHHLRIGDMDITPFTIPHDAADPCGFVFESEGIRLGFATDLGYVPPNVKLALKGCDVLLLESNHDLEMLRDGPYPWSVKQRVLSRVGHLSNDAAAEFLTRDYDGNAQYVVLAHLSENNNMPEMAMRTAEMALQGYGSLLGNKLLVARQDAPLEPIVL